MKQSFLIILLLVSFSLLSNAQKADRVVKKALLRYERSYGINFNTDGWGFGYRYGKAKTFTNKKTWDFTFSFIRDSKQIRYYSPYDNTAKSFFYGKLNNFYSLQVLRGRQKILTEKPYWGGVEVRFFYFGGFNLGIAKPIYLYVIDYENGGVLSLERYDAQSHNLEDIYGRGPFTKGLNELGIHPGLSFKIGLNVEFGPYQERTKALEAGFIVDGYVIPVQLMGFDDAKYAMMRLYVAYRFGKRYNSTN
jgi:hypothetical protein